MGKVRYSEHPSMEDAELVTLRGKKITVTDEEFAMMLEKAGGFKSRVAKQLGISVSAVCHRIQRSEYLREACKTVEETILDLAEASLVKAAQNGEPWAVTFILKCKGRKRGWIERQDVVFGDGGEEPPPPFVIELHDSQYIEEERKRQEAELERAIGAMTVDVTPIAGTGGGERTESTTGATENAPKPEEKQAPAPEPKPAEKPGEAPVEAKPEPKPEPKPQPPSPPPPPPRPLRPSEVEALKRARMEAQGVAKPQTGPTGRYMALPAGFHRR